MQDLIIKGSEKTPFFNLLESGKLSFGGISMPEDAAQFYFEIIDWISDYYRSPKEGTEVIVTFRYLNSSSSSMVLKIFHTLNRLQATGKTNIRCKWYYEEDDKDMLDYIQSVMDIADKIEFTILSRNNILEF